ncbi:MAG: ABC transporter ATP-binding protein [Thermoclostridium sp.]|nr:ABC transporter ATP-binding protein [Thermoclostridium sp.]
MIKLTGIQKKYNKNIILSDLQMTFEDQAITAILGPSGCGKTTLLKIVAGLIPADAGEVSGMENRVPGFLFQEPRLLPWMNAMQNLDFVLPETMDMSEKNVLCKEMLAAVGLAGYEKHYPSQLSGGMSQRLSIARAFIIRSDILFMDEPFQSLDIKRREKVFRLFKDLWLKHRPAVLMVTHDVQEALLLSDKIYILSDKPTAILKEIHNPMPFEERSVQNEVFFQLEQQIINQYLI